MRTAALDSEQRRVVHQLDRLGAAVLGGTTPPGLYLHGAVGRGKTWLCDRFFEQLPTTAKLRVHFHSFFQQLHRDTWGHRADGDPDAAGDAVARAVASLLDGVDLLYFDEFHVNDSGNAALVRRVLAELLSRRVTLLATSNYPPQELLPGPFHHVFAAGIELLEANLQVVELAGTTDYRRSTYRRSVSGRSVSGRSVSGRSVVARGGVTGSAVARGATGFAKGHWLVPGTDAQLALAGLSRPAAAERSRLSAGGHRFTAEQASGRQLWFRFGELCERDTSVTDYLEWAVDFDAWVLEGVPEFSEMSSHALQRFTNLVDVLCDRDLTLHVISAHPPATGTGATSLPLERARTASRLTPLQQPTDIHTQH